MKPLTQLVIAAQKGDREAFAEIIARFEDNAQARAYRVLRDYQLAEDAVQEAFAEAFLNLEKLREPAAFPGWFRRIVIKRIDRLIRGKKLPTTSIETAYESPSVADDPGEGVDLADTGATLSDALDALPEHEREVARQYYFEGRSQKDIADAFGVPTTTIKKRLYASRQRLKRRLADLQPVDLSAGDRSEDLPAEVQLFAAARSGFAYKADALLARSPELIHATNEDGLNVLQYAVHASHHSGNSGVVDVLLARGAEIDLHVAAALGMRVRLDEVFRSDPGATKRQGAWARTPLHWSASGGHTALSEWLLARETNPNARDLWGCTPLHLAAELGREETVEMLVSRGADVHARLKNGKGVLHVAAQSGNIAIVERLLRHDAQLDVFAAASLGLKDRVHKMLSANPELVNARLPFGATPLHMAAEEGRIDMAEFLVERGATPDLVCAAELGWTEAVNRLLEEEPGVVNRKAGSFGFTALHSATSKGHRDLARLLLNSGAEVNATDDMYNKTPLGEALYYGNEAMARLLFRHGGESYFLFGEKESRQRKIDVE